LFQGGYFQTALHTAAVRGHVSMVEFLLEEGFKDKPGMMATSKHIYNPNYSKVNIFNQCSKQQQWGGMFSWYNSSFKVTITQNVLTKWVSVSMLMPQIFDEL
jgi:ankyrin repeat protein